MAVQRGRNILFILIGVAVSGTLVAIPFVLNAIVDSRLDARLAREKVASAVESQTGLALTVQGVKYRFLRGLVFQGVRIQPKGAPHGQFILQTESLVLHLSVLAVLRGRNPFTRVSISEGKLNPYALDAKGWRSVLDQFAAAELARRKASGTEVAESDLSRLEIAAQGLQLVVPEAIIPGGRKRMVDRMRLDFRIRPQDRRWFADISTGSDEGAAAIQARGRWGGPDARRINFKFSRVPLPLLYRLTARLPIWPPELRVPAERMRVDAGQLAGRGSLDFTGSGVGLNFAGNHSGVRVQLGDPAGFYVATSEAQGRFRYSTAYLAFADGPAQTELEVRQDDLELRARFRDVRLQQNREHTIETSLRATLSAPRRGKAGVHLGVPGGITEGWIQPELKASLRNLQVRFTAPLFQVRNLKDGKDHPIVLRFADGLLEQKPGQRLKLRASGDLDGAPLRVTGESDSYFLLDPDAAAPSLLLSQDLKGEVVIEKLPYRKLLVPAARIHGSLIAEAGRPNAGKAEEHRLLGNYQFIDPVYERAFFSNTKVDVRLRLADLQDAGAAWPRNIEAQFRKDYYTMQFLVPETSGPTSKMSFELLTRPSNRPMPYHDVRGSIEVTGNHIAFPELLGNDLPPSEVRATFRAYGQGWYAYDIVNHTFSEMSLEVRRVDLSALQAAVILKHKLQMKAEDFLVDEFLVKRRTDLSRFYYYPIEVRTKRLNLKAWGEYFPQQGGEMNMQYEWKPGTTKDGKEEVISDRLDLVISAEDQWVPRSTL